MQEIINKILSGNSFALFSHENPDPDTIGSTLALKKILEKLGKKVGLYCESDIDSSYFIFEDAKKYNSVYEKADCDISVDVASDMMLGKYRGDFLAHENSIRIDHHVSGGNFAKLNLVEPDSACAIIIYKLATALQVEIDSEIATLLFFGICGDTGIFRNSNTDSLTFEVCGKLLALGADIKWVYSEFYDKKTVPYIKMSSHILENAIISDEFGFVVLVASAEDYEKYGLDPKNDNLSNLPNNYLSCGYKVAAILKEKQDGIHCSFRSKYEYDVSAIAAELGGGGHKNAAGCKIDGSLQSSIELVISKLRRI